MNRSNAILTVESSMKRNIRYIRTYKQTRHKKKWLKPQSKKKQENAAEKKKKFEEGTKCWALAFCKNRLAEK